MQRAEVFSKEIRQIRIPDINPYHVVRIKQDADDDHQRASHFHEHIRIFHKRPDVSDKKRHEQKRNGKA